MNQYSILCSLGPVSVSLRNYYFYLARTLNQFLYFFLCFEHLCIKEKSIMVSTITLSSTTIYNIGNNNKCFLSSKSALQWTFFTFPGFSAAEVVIVGITWRAVNGRVPQIYFFASAVKRLIAINHIQNKRFCLHNICMCTVFIYYVYINTHTYSIYLENIYMYIHLYIYIIIFYIIYKYI